MLFGRASVRFMAHAFTSSITDPGGALADFGFDGADLLETISDLACRPHLVVVGERNSYIFSSFQCSKTDIKAREEEEWLRQNEMALVTKSQSALPR